MATTPTLTRWTTSINSVSPRAASSSSTPSDTRTTNTHVRALTTPFIQPSECTGSFTATSTLYYESYYSRFVSAYLEISDTAWPGYATCEPSGWAVAPNWNRYTYSPGVCPQSWTAYNLGAWSADTHKTVSTAYCCSSGFVYYGIIPDLSIDFDATPAPSYCARYMQSTEMLSATATDDSMEAASTENPYAGLFPTSTELMQFHLAYVVSWERKDALSMSPYPPPVPCETTALASWVPGTNVTGINEFCPAVKDDKAWFYFEVIGIPLLVFSFLFACAGCFLYGTRKEKKQKRRMTEMANRAQIREATERHEFEQAVTNSLVEMGPIGINPMGKVGESSKALPPLPEDAETTVDKMAIVEEPSASPNMTDQETAETTTKDGKRVIYV